METAEGQITSKIVYEILVFLKISEFANIQEIFSETFKDFLRFLTTSQVIRLLSENFKSLEIFRDFQELV